MGGFAWVTLATNDSYALGALVLANSLKRVNTAHQLVILITPGVSESMKTQLSAIFNVVKLVDVLDSGDADNLALMARPDLGITFTKLHCWKLTQFDKCVFLDADTLVVQNSDELFDREELSAAADVGWPDCFNSGVFVYKPSDDTFKALIDFALIHGSFDGGDQGLLNLFFSDWATKDIKKHLPFVYNMVFTSTYSYLPAFKQFGHGLKILHFIGSIKPWLQPLNTETGLVQTGGMTNQASHFLQLWWDLFCTHVHPTLNTEMAGLAGALAAVTLGAPLSAEQAAIQEHLRRQDWEQGNIDYMGKDSFSNIWQKICSTLAVTQITPVESPAPVAPVAAPTFVSSVEISPAGPVDTSPPPSYTPVSALKPTTVVASKAESATDNVAVPADATAVVPESVSPSVTELVTPATLEPTLTEVVKEPSSITPALVESIASSVPENLSPVETGPVVIQCLKDIPSEVTLPPTITPTESIATVIQPEITKITEAPTTIHAPNPLAVTPTTTIVQTPTPVLSIQSGSNGPTPIPLPVTPTIKSDPLSPIAPPEQTPIPLSASPPAVVEVPSNVQAPPATSPEAPAVLETPQTQKPTTPPTPGDASITSTLLPLTPIATPPQSQTIQTETPPPATTQPQPQTPTVTQPTPPTSPPSAEIQSPLAAKLQVQSDIPATPPVGGTSAQPSMTNVPSEEPPVPPKRKGGAKASQEGKPQKGKPKGKK